MTEHSTRVVSTYRLQLHAGFTLDDVCSLLPYFASLGVSHLYLSPITTAAPGSTHGYDMIDPTQISPDLGGDEAYTALVDAQQAAGLGQVLDVVPNHMGIASGSGNTYWEDVLRHGPASKYADVFDVDWTPIDGAVEGRVTLPILDAEQSEVIARGAFSVELDGEWLRYDDVRLPLRPGSLHGWSEDSGLAALLHAQHYNLEHWRTGAHRLNYRRFFAINDLIGVRVEEPTVFDLVHSLTIRLVATGAVDGLRIDHPDGLRDPEGYLERLRTALDASGRSNAYLVLEKILAADEQLADAWRSDGTTGYDFMTDMTRALIATDQAARFTSAYELVTGRSDDYERVASTARAQFIEGSELAAQFTRIGQRLHAETNTGLDPDSFLDAFRRLLSHVDRYRTYHRVEAVDESAHDVIKQALTRATHEDGESQSLNAVAAMLAHPPAGPAREAIMDLQQIMPAIQAKALEDCASYDYRRLLALNEVGGDPGRFGIPLDEFHTRMRDASVRRPHRMLTTATHDHKRGEDVRARLAALSELPAEWEEAAASGLAALDQLQQDNSVTVDADDRYLLLQTLAGCDPAGMTQGREGDEDFARRVSDYFVKALREAGARTRWVDGDAEYERAAATLASQAVSDQRVQDALTPLLDQVVRAGAVNSLTQTAVKLTGPGVPDTFQGNEFWDLTLVDPDNRRAVDFAIRARRLASIEDALADGPEGDRARAQLVPASLANWRDGTIKLYVLARLLRIRRTLPALFLDGAYEPLAATGDHATNVIAFARRAEDALAAVVATRLSTAINGAPRDIAEPRTGTLWRPSWGTTRLSLPRLCEGARWRDVLTGATFEGISEVGLGDLLGVCPVAVLVSEAV